jgi:hypothetical protein
MKIIFEGLNRYVLTHRHTIHPYIKNSDTMVWESSTKAYGMIFGLRLNGDFKLRIDFQEDELKNWLEKFVEEEPEKGLRLISDIQYKTIKKLLTQIEQNK